MSKNQLVQNLERLIAEKEALLSAHQRNVQIFDDLDDQCDSWLKSVVTVGALETNIGDLRKILADVHQLED